MNLRRPSVKCLLTGRQSLTTYVRILQDLRRALLHPPTRLHPTDGPSLAPVT
ncbi:hypothetical protein GCM10020001_039370 [Nonomuraea salmonea]